MLRTLHIRNFRLFQDLKLDSLNRVNLIAGVNNSGKTALLEALCLLFGDIRSFMDFPSALRSTFPMDSVRGRMPVIADEFENFWMWLFHQKNMTRPMEIEAVGAQGTYLVKAVDQSLRDSSEFGLDYFMDGRNTSSRTASKGNGASGNNNPAGSEWPRLITFSTNSSSPTDDAEYFNRIAAKRGGEQRVVELLRVIEPRLQDLKYLKLGNQPLVYADVGMEDLIPTTQLGQGFTRLLRLFSEILVAKSEIVLIDEVENGIHYSAMPKVWKGIAAIAQQENLQFFATTHSYECIRSAHEAFASGLTGDVEIQSSESQRNWAEKQLTELMKSEKLTRGEAINALRSVGTMKFLEFLGETDYALALHRLERDDAGNVRVVSLDRESLDTSLKLEWEVR